MIHPTPPGTRDILPDEMRELRALEARPARRLRGARLRRGRDPDDRVRRGARGAATSAYANAAYRFFDERGDLLAMRSDMTIPIARLVATRCRTPSRRSASATSRSAYRAVSPQRGQMREFTQAGVELIGAPAPEGTAEVIEVLSAALDAAG